LLRGACPVDLRGSRGVRERSLGVSPFVYAGLASSASPLRLTRNHSFGSGLAARLRRPRLLGLAFSASAFHVRE